MLQVQAELQSVQEQLQTTLDQLQTAQDQAKRTQEQVYHLKTENANLHTDLESLLDVSAATQTTGVNLIRSFFIEGTLTRVCN